MKSIRVNRAHLPTTADYCHLRSTAGGPLLLCASVILVSFVVFLIAQQGSHVTLDEPLFVSGNLILAGFFLLLSAVIFFWGYKSPAWDLFSPQRLFFTEWFFVLGLDSLRLTRIEAPFTVRTWLIIASGMASFYFAGRIAAARYNKRRWRPLKELINACLPKWDHARSLFLIIGIFAIASLALAYELYRFGQIPIFASDVEAARNSYAANSYIQRLAISFYVIPPLCYLLSLTMKKKFRNIIRLLGVLSFLPFILTAASFFVINGLAIVGVCFWYGQKRIRASYVVAIILLAVALKAGVDTFRYYDTGFFENVLYNQGYPSALLPIAPYYFYIAMNLQVFQKVTELIPNYVPYSYGYYVSYPVRVFWSSDKATGAGGKSHGQIEDLLWQRTINWFGFSSVTLSFMGDSYGDLGWIGVILYSFLFGWFASWWYGRFRSNPTFWNLFVHAHICFAILLSFFAPYFDGLHFYWALIVTAAFSCLARKRVSINANGRVQADTRCIAEASQPATAI